MFSTPSGTINSFNDPASSALPLGGVEETRATKADFKELPDFLLALSMIEVGDPAGPLELNGDQHANGN